MGVRWPRLNAIPVTAENRYRWCMDERPNETADRDAAEERQRASGPFVMDAEMIRRMGVPEKVARVTIRMLDRDPHSGFPKKQPLWVIEDIGRPLGHGSTTSTDLDLQKNEAAA